MRRYFKAFLKTRRLGNSDGKEYSLEEVSQDVSIATVRVRQLKDLALNQFRGDTPT